MFKLIIVLLLISSFAYAGNNDITILKTNSITVASANAIEYGRGEIRLMCIAGYKVVVIKIGSIESAPVSFQLLGKDNKPVFCSE